MNYLIQFLRHKTVLAVLTLGISLSIVIGSTLARPYISPNAVNVSVTPSPLHLSLIERNRMRDDYWAKRRGMVTIKMRQNALAQAALLQHSSALPSAGYSDQQSMAPASAGLPSNTWNPIGPAPLDLQPTHTYHTGHFSGRVTALAVDPQQSGTIYLGTAEGGVWKTTNDGQFWTNITENQPNQPSLAIGALAIDPMNSNIIYAGLGQAYAGYGGNGILKSTNGGSSWQLLGASTFGGTRQPSGYPYTGGISKIAINPLNSNQLFVALANSTINSDGLYRSDDGGGNFTHVLGSGLPSGGVDDVVIDELRNPIRIYVTVRQQGLYRSDGGTSWTNISNPTSTSGFLAASGFNRSVLAMAPSNHNIIYAAVLDQAGHIFVNGSYRGIFYTSNGGDTWSNDWHLNIDFTGGQDHAFFLLVDPIRPNVVYGGGVSLAMTYNAWGYALCAANADWIDITTVGGATHPDQNIHEDENAMAFTCNNNSQQACFYEGNDGGVWRATLNYNATLTSTPTPSLTPTPPTLTPTLSPGPTFCIIVPTPYITPTVVFSNVNNPALAIAQMRFGDIGPNFSSTPLALAGLQDNAAAMYTGNSVWRDIDEGDGSSTVVDWATPGVLYYTLIGSQPNRIKKSTDGGQNWVDVGSGINAGAQVFAPLQMDRANSSHLVYAAGATVYETLNGASSWYIGTSSDLPGVIGSIAIGRRNPYNQNHTPIYAAIENSNQIWKTVDGGSGSSSTYSQISGTGPDSIPADNSINEIRIDPQDPTAQTVYVVTSDRNYATVNHAGHVFMTNTGNAPWHEVTGNLPSIPVYSVVTYRSGKHPVVVVGTEIGVFYTVDPNLSTWIALTGTGSTALPNASVQELAIDPATTSVVAFTFGRSAWYTNIPQSTSTGDTIGIYNTANGEFYLSNDNVNILKHFVWGPGNPWSAITGDWDANGIDTIGIYNTANGEFYLSNDNNTVANHFVWGPGGTWIAITGDWDGNGTITIGIYNTSNGEFYLSNDDATVAAHFWFGPGGSWTPIVGNWTGANGHDTIGIYNTANGEFYLSNDNNTVANHFVWGPGGTWKAIVGHWGGGAGSIPPPPAQGAPVATPPNAAPTFVPKK